MLIPLHIFTLGLLCAAWSSISRASTIPRKAIVSRYNPVRNASSTSTPMQVGNGFFAFGADVSGLQTFLPWATMSDWAWKNDSLPMGVTYSDILSYRGVVWDGVQYEFGGPAAPQQWLIANPNRMDLGRIGLLFRTIGGQIENVTEADLTNVRQELDLWTGVITSQFVFDNEEVSVQTYAAQSSSAVGVTIRSQLLQQGRLGIFLDFPWNDGSEKFQAPFVGYWSETSRHTTTMHTGSDLGGNVFAQINHTLVTTTYLTSLGSSDRFVISRDSPDLHRYSVLPVDPFASFSLVVSYSSRQSASIPSVSDVGRESVDTWQQYWSSNGFVDVITGSTDSRADELQRRIILSRYLMRVNEAGFTPPQEVRVRGASMTSFR